MYPGRQLLCLVGLLLATVVSAAPEPRVLLVSFDGFRWDYLRRYNTSWFNYVLKKGASTTDGSYNATFTTKSLPGHYTIVTGLYEESHGIVDNKMFDPANAGYFSINNRTAQRDPFWWTAEPIWIAAERAGLRAGTFFWPGSQVPYRGRRQKFWKIFDTSVSFTDRVDTVVHWLSKEGVSFATIYFEEPDSTGHKAGPFSPKTRRAVERMDEVLGYLVLKLKAAGIYESVNLILTSDHGMSRCNATSVVPFYKVIYRRRRELLRHIISHGGFFGLNAKSGKVMELYQYLYNASQRPEYSMLTVYHKGNMPARFHYRNNRRIPDVLVLAKEGYFVQSRWPRRPKPIPPQFGCHGYDNALPSMRPFFITRGPQIRIGARVKPFQQVDIYNFLAHLLKIDPRPNNGSWSRVVGLLNNVGPTYGNVFSAGSRQAPAPILVCPLSLLLLLTLLLSGPTVR